MERLEKLVNKHHEENIPLISVDINEEHPRIVRARKCVTSWDTKSTIITVCSIIIIVGGIKLLTF